MWYKRWGVPFQSFGGTQYMVNIYEKTSGAVTYLTGSDNPFVTQEDNSDDIFKPVRGQTGYLRVIDETGDGSLLESLMPVNNTDKMVTLETGTWNNDYTIFTPDTGGVEWQGFLCARAFTQPWGKNKRVLEFPVCSFLSALSYVQMSEDVASRSANLAALLVSAFKEMLQDDSQTAFDDVLILDGMDHAISTSFCLYPRFQWAVFFEESIVNNQGDSQSIVVGQTYQSALSEAMKLFGMTVRENGRHLYMAQYDTPTNPQRWAWLTWSAVVSAAAGQEYIYQEAFAQDQSILDNNGFVFAGDKNVAGFLMGKGVAKVVLSLHRNAMNITFPSTTEDESPVSSIQYMYQGIAKVQPHEPRISDREAFYFRGWRYTYQLDKTAQTNNWYWYIYYLGTSTYEYCLGNSVINHPRFNPIGNIAVSSEVFVGAFPCRWFYSPNSAAAVDLDNGLFLNQIFQRPPYADEDGKYVFNSDMKVIYSLTSELEFEMKNGYIHINVNMHSFIYYWATQPDEYMSKIFVDTVPNIQGFENNFYIALSVGNKYWNGSAWVDTETAFPIKFKDSTIDTNKTPSMAVDESDGWFIPVNTALAGKVTIKIYDRVATYHDGFPGIEAHSRIMSNLTVKHLEERSVTASDRSENVYREQVTGNGFSDDAEILLSLGTMNNNRASTSFIFDANGEYIKKFKYQDGTQTGTEQRPELHLLDRMVDYYGEVRRTFRAVVETGKDLFGTRWTYLGRKFLGIDSTHRWRDDKQEVKFIEVT